MHAVDLKLNAADVAGFEAWMRRRLPTRYRFPLPTVIVMVAMFAVFIIAATTPAGLLALFGWIVAVWIAVLLMRRGSGNPIARDRAIDMSGHVTLSEDGLEWTSTDAWTRRRWNGFARVVDTPHHIYLMTSLGSGYVVPKRCFADAEAAQAFYQYAHDRAFRIAS